MSETNSAEPFLAEADYLAIIDANREHGRTLFCDLYVWEKYRGEIPVKIPRIFPKAIKPGPTSHLHLLLPEDGHEIRLDEPTGYLHGKQVRYAQMVKPDGTLRWLRRYLADGGGNLLPINSHYHVQDLDHRYRVSANGPTLVGVGGTNIDGFDDVFESLNQDCLIYTGGLPDEPILRPRPESELGSYLLRAFVQGIRDGVSQYHRQDVFARTEQLLDRLPH